MTSQVPSPEFLSLVQHLELSRAGWWDKALERFILASFWTSPQSKTSTKVSAEIAAQFHIDIDPGRLGPHLDRLVGVKTLVQLPGREFVLGEDARRDYTRQIGAAADTEAAAERAFSAIVAPIVPGTPVELWRHFHATFLVPLIKELGATTYNLLTRHALEPLAVRLDTYLGFYPEPLRRPLQSAVHTFLDPANVDVRSYVLCLLNAYLVLEAVSLSGADLKAVVAQLSTTPTFDVIVDTNFLFSILGLHDNPSNEAAQGLIRLGRVLAGHVKVRFHVLPLTLEETHRVLVSHRDSLKGFRLSADMARAALNRASSSITVRFLDHVSKGGSPNSAEAYFEPYINNLLTILRSKGAELFNENIDRYRTRQDVIDDIVLQTEYEKKHHPERPKSYEQILHDTVLWHFAADKRPPRFDSPVEAGYWIVTLDHRLMGFDRFKRKGRTGIPLCLEPTILSQLLQFWMPRSPELEQVVLGSIRMPLMFHAFDRDSERVTVDILRSLGRYESVAQLPREAVTAIVVNDALRVRIGSSHSEDEKIELVKDALVSEFERTKTALDQAVESERTARDSLEEKERALDSLKTELMTAARAAEESEKLKALARGLEAGIKEKDQAIEDLRKQVTRIGDALEAARREAAAPTLAEQESRRRFNAVDWLKGFVLRHLEAGCLGLGAIVVAGMFLAAVHIMQERGATLMAPDASTEPRKTSRQHRSVAGVLTDARCGKRVSVRGTVEAVTLDHKPLGSGQLRTDELGQFRLEVPTAMPFLLIADARGYESRSASVSTTDTEINVGLEPHVLRISIPNGATLDGMCASFERDLDLSIHFAQVGCTAAMRKLPIADGVLEGYRCDAKDIIGALLKRVRDGGRSRFRVNELQEPAHYEIACE